MLDVIAVNLKTKTVRLVKESVDQRNADAIIKMAVYRRGVEEEFFLDVPHGRYKNGDTYRGK